MHYETIFEETAYEEQIHPDQNYDDEEDQDEDEGDDSDEDNVVVKDSNGAVLKDGDSVSVIKDLKVKGSSITLKRGTIIKKIKLTGSEEEVDCKFDGSSIVLKTCFLKKA